jgi:hypothetical protein
MSSQHIAWQPRQHMSLDIPSTGAVWRHCAGTEVCLPSCHPAMCRHVTLSSRHVAVPQSVHRVGALTSDPELKEIRVDVCQELFLRYETDGNSFLKRIMTGGESWVHCYQPEMKRAGKEWYRSCSQKHKNFCKQASVQKVMLTLFWDHSGPLVEHYMSKGTAVTNTSYCSLFRNHLRAAIRSKHHGLLSTGVLLLMTTLGHILPTWQLRRSETVILSVSLICHPHMTSPLVNNIFLGLWRRLLV